MLRRVEAGRKGVEEVEVSAVMRRRERAAWRV
jgi:hypothetical protein